MGLERWHWEPPWLRALFGIPYTEYTPKVRSVKITEFESKIRSA